MFVPFLGMLNGCDALNDRLDLDNIGSYDPGNIWNAEETAQYVVNDLISLTIGGGWSNVGGWGDECAIYNQVNAVTVDNGTQKYWPYGTVRRLNQALLDADAGGLTEAELSRIKGQIYFLRAYVYFGMVMQHGGVPIITHPQSRDEDLFVFRNTTAETFNFIIEDLDRALASGMLDRAQGGNYGRLSKAAVKAFKGRVLLHKASPMFNPNNPWDNQYWQAAYNANKQAYTDLSALGFSLVPTYDDIFKSTKGQIDENSEYILLNILRHPTSNMGWRTRQIRPLSKSSGDTSYDQPYWEFIELYPMADGYPIGESPNYEYTVDTYFANRDPRFYRSIIYNAGPTNFGEEFNRIYTTDELDGLAPYFDSWADVVRGRPGTFMIWNRTGFFPKKQIMEENTLTTIQENDKDFPFIRFAEVIMNLAEAANETGNQAEALEMLKLIRARAGIEPGGDGNYGIDNSGREALRAVIHNERAIEFLWEHKRFTDMRRWRRLHEWDQREMHVLYPTVKPEYWVDYLTEIVPEKDPSQYLLLPEDFNYTPLVLNSGGITYSVYPENYYFFPIQLSHLELNPNLEQNIGWDNGTFDPTLP